MSKSSYNKVFKKLIILGNDIFENNEYIKYITFKNISF